MSDKMTQEEALEWVKNQLEGSVRLRCVDRGLPGFVLEGPNHEYISVHVKVVPGYLIEKVEGS